MNLVDLPIDQTGLSVRACNVLHRAGKNTLGEMMECTEDQLMGLRNAGRKTVDEILQKCEEYKKRINSGADAVMLESAETNIPDLEANPEAWLTSETGRAAIAAVLRASSPGIETLEQLSVRSYNLLRMSGIQTLSGLMTVSQEDLAGLPGMDDAALDEIQRLRGGWLKAHRAVLLEKTVSEKPDALPLADLISLPENRDAAVAYAEVHDCPIEALGLSNRAKNQLLKNGYEKLSDILFLTASELSALSAMGTQSVKDVLERRSAWLEQNAGDLRAILAGDTSVLRPPAPSDEALRAEILRLYDGVPYAGFSLQDFADKLPDNAETEQIKRCVGSLLAAGELEYVDYRCYRVYPKFAEVVQLCPKLSDRDKEIALRRLSGKTLEDVGKEYGVERERIRQIMKKCLHKAQTQLKAETGAELFDEDYYLYFYQTYALDRKDCAQWFGISTDSIIYLDLKTEKHLAEPLEDAQEDLRLGSGLRQRVRNYINRDKLFLDGRWIPKKRGVLERYVVENFCTEDVSYDEFQTLYNTFLQDQGVSYDEDVYLTDAVKPTRKNRLRDSRFLLWKQHETLRAYDIDGRDYADLISGLGLNDLENIEISTQKLVEEHPDVLAQYDIRDQYELHNLLRKILSNGDLHDFQIERTPNILFGQFDRNKAIMDIIAANAPITQQKLLEMIHEEYGHDAGTIAGTYLAPFSAYYHQGEYRTDQKLMTPEHQSALLDALDGDFYFIEKLKSIYCRMFPDADPEEINRRNLKSMGFEVRSNYALRNYSSLNAYFREMLTREDLLDITELRRRYTYVQAFSMNLMELKRSLEVVEYEPNKLIAFRRLNAAGIERADIEAFCDAVYDIVEDGSYFTIKSLRLAGFETQLYELGFSDWFYANLLLSDSRFSYVVTFRNYVFFKGKTEVTTRSFETALIRAAGSIDVYDLQRMLEETYGCTVSDRLDLIYKVQDSAVFYDRHMDRLYDSESRYWREVDEAEGL